MKWRISTYRGFWPISVFGLLAVSVALWGCSRELSSAPSPEASRTIAVQEVDDNTGEIIIVPRGVTGLPKPGGAVAELIAANTVLIRWTPPLGSYGVRVTMNGCELGVIPSTEGSYLDRCPKPVGVYVYELCYCKGGVTGPRVILPVAIMDHASPHMRDRGTAQDRVTDGVR